MRITSHNISIIRTGIIGILLVFSSRIFIELFVSPLFFFVGAVIFFFAYILARTTHHHFAHNHSHEGDSVIDAVPLWILMFANILHPAVDGFSFWEILQNEGVVAGVVVGASIGLHELVRQSALIFALKRYGVWWGTVVLTALLGISVGVLAGATHTEFLHTYEYVAELLTLFAYGFIIFDSLHHRMSQRYMIPIGVIVGVVLTFFMYSH